MIFLTNMYCVLTLAGRYRNDVQIEMIDVEISTKKSLIATGRLVLHAV